MNTKRYVKNLELFARDNPLQTFHIEESLPLKYCATYEKELNLIEETHGRQLFLHAQEGAVLESQYWAKMLPLESCDVIFVYGLGLGYYYLPLKEWLENSKHYLVFLEDNPSVLSAFLHTRLATKILENHQVIVKCIPRFEQNEEGWARLRAVAADLFWAFALLRPHISALQAYLVSRFDYFRDFSLQWLTALSRAERSIVEFYPYPELVFHNFYANIFYLGETIPGYALAGVLKSFPAVLCGAGPSLEKQFSHLKKLEDRAFVIASGSAMNALTHAGIFPHVGGAIDPTPAQASRQLTSVGFEVPAFYQNRFFDEAFLSLHGQLLFMVGSGSNRISEWFERELGVQGAEQIIMGVSTSNFLLEIAGFLGCSPIVLVGMDLAYSDDKRYAKGVLAHPVDSDIEHHTLIKRQEGLLPVPGVEGKDVYITNHWFYEAVCMAAFKQRNPEVDFLNATEGGMAIPLIPNVAFSETIDIRFREAWDIRGWFHGAIQNASQEQIFTDRVIQTIEKWKKSLESCASSLTRLIEYFRQELVSLHQMKPPFILYRGKAALWQSELFLEPAYEFFLEGLGIIFEGITALRVRQLKGLEDPHERNKEKIAIEIERCLFLMRYVRGNLKDINDGESAYIQRQSVLSKSVEQNETVQGDVEPPEYRLEEGWMTIREPMLGVDLKAVFLPQQIPVDSWPRNSQEPLIEALIGKMHDKREGQTLYFYPNGRIKAEAFYHLGELHGPWSFYSPDGILLYRSWYIQGKKEGRSSAYYANGELYCLRGYCNGCLQGCQRYYYRNGVLKTSEHYDKGVLDGVVHLYYSNGRLKKEQHFSNGEWHGQERVWDELGILRIEASYEYGKVVGVSKKWHANGRLARRVVHGNESEKDLKQAWNENGRPVETEEK